MPGKAMKAMTMKTVKKPLKNGSGKKITNVEKAAASFAKAAKKSTSLPKFLRDRDKRKNQPQTAKGLVRLKAEKVSMEDPKLLAFRNLAGWWSPDGWSRECQRRSSLGYTLKFRNSWWVRKGQSCTVDSKNRLKWKKDVHEVMNCGGVRWGYYAAQ
eukprot:gnl/TRDRNA2_/TRDRNA2_195454_c0_seq1.p1 gnl/TRDRNA2_/TRDRNA2_195454_c0~~gnl/TRDRNA2_/TRDRNA2_195454_c0_seq1.p1  ORF type:complete len:156 (+),score=28.14 gnl/TRDRNA2_/TRDRNA2_195454_c0_seq1:69-536(+)